MDQAQTTTSATTATNPDTATVTGLDSRMSDVLAEFGSSGSADAGSDASETTTTDAPTEKPAKADKVETAPEPATTTDADTRKAERKARLDELRAKDQAKLAAKQQREQADTGNARLAQLEKELADTKARAARLDRLKDDPSAALELLQAEGVSSEVLGEYLRTGGDPAALSSKRARAELMPELEAIKAQQEADRAELAALKAERDQERAVTTRQQATHDFLQTASKTAADFPLATRWRERRGDEQLIAMAEAVGPSLPSDATYTDLLGLIEEQLEEFASLRGEPSPTEKPKTPAAAKAPALTNQVAAESSVVDDEDAPRDFDARQRATEKWLRG